MKAKLPKSPTSNVCSSTAPKVGRGGKTYLPPKPRKKKSGEEKFSWSDYDRHLGYVARGPDDIARAFPDEKNCAEFKHCQDLLEKFCEAWKAWKTIVQKGRDRG